MVKEKFDGDGFSHEPLDGHEAAKHRQMYHEVSANWTIFEEATTLISGGKIAGRLVILGGAMGGALKYFGWL